MDILCYAVHESSTFIIALVSTETYCKENAFSALMVDVIYIVILHKVLLLFPFPIYVFSNIFRYNVIIVRGGLDLF